MRIIEKETMRIIEKKIVSVKLKVYVFINKYTT